VYAIPTPWAASLLVTIWGVARAVTPLYWPLTYAVPDLCVMLPVSQAAANGGLWLA
jgi:hypothetical protein